MWKCSVGLLNLGNELRMKYEKWTADHGQDYFDLNKSMLKNEFSDVSLNICQINLRLNEIIHSFDFLTQIWTDLGINSLLVHILSLACQFKPSIENDMPHSDLSKVFGVNLY